MSLLPIFLKLEGRQCLLVGAGTVALDKIGSLLKTGLRLRVVAPDAKSEVRQLALEGKLEWIERAFEPADLDGNYHRHCRDRFARSERGCLSGSGRTRHSVQQRRRHSQLRLLLRFGGEPRRFADRHFDCRRKPRRGAAVAPRDRCAIAPGPWSLAGQSGRTAPRRSGHSSRAAKSASAAAPVGATAGVRLRIVPVAAPGVGAPGQASSRTRAERCGWWAPDRAIPIC